MELEARSLAAIGAPAVEALINLLDDGSEWSRINAAFALGEMDSGGRKGVASLVACLDDRSHRVVRTALDALGSIRRSMSVTDISPLLENGRREWEKELLRGWSAQDQVRTNAAMACARLGKRAAPAEEALVRALDDPCGHVGSFAMYALRRLGTLTASAAVQNFLLAQRWDPSIRADRQF